MFDSSQHLMEIPGTESKEIAPGNLGSEFFAARGTIGLSGGRDA